jgi:hypothetical protein
MVSRAQLQAGGPCHRAFRARIHLLEPSESRAYVTRYTGIWFLSASALSSIYIPIFRTRHGVHKSGPPKAKPENGTGVSVELLLSSLEAMFPLSPFELRRHTTRANHQRAQSMDFHWLQTSPVAAYKECLPSMPRAEV